VLNRCCTRALYTARALWTVIHGTFEHPPSRHQDSVRTDVRILYRSKRAGTGPFRELGGDRAPDRFELPDGRDSVSKPGVDHLGDGITIEGAFRLVEQLLPVPGRGESDAITCHRKP
jgi:hypothetical protein